MFSGASVIFNCRVEHTSSLPPSLFKQYALNNNNVVCNKFRDPPSAEQFVILSSCFFFLLEMTRNMCCDESHWLQGDCVLPVNNTTWYIEVHGKKMLNSFETKLSGAEACEQAHKQRIPLRNSQSDCRTWVAKIVSCALHADTSLVDSIPGCY